MSRKKKRVKPKFRCDQCPMQFDSGKDRQRHQREAHGPAALEEQKKIKEGEQAWLEQRGRNSRMDDQVAFTANKKAEEILGRTQVNEYNPPPRDITHATSKRRG